MSDGTYRDRWMDEVFRTPLLSPEVQVFLLLLGRHMDENGFVSERSADLARAINCTERRVASKFATAISSEFLARVSRGQKGQTAVYRALVPALQGDSRRHPEGNVQPDGRRHPEPSQGDDRRQAEAKVQGASRRHPERVKPNFQGDDRRQAESAPIYKDRARAHSRDHLSHSPEHPEVDDHGRAGVVVPLFEEQNKNTEKHTQRAKRAVTPDRFDEFWAAYPKRVAKGTARKAWDKALKNGTDPEEIIWGARAYATSPRRAAADIQYTAHPATWLNAERWSDEAEPEHSTATAPMSTADRRVAEIQALKREMCGPADDQIQRPTIRGEIIR